MLNCAQQIPTIKQPPDISKQKRGRKSSHSLLWKAVTSSTSTHDKTLLRCCSNSIVNRKSPAPPNRHASKTLKIELAAGIAFMCLSVGFANAPSTLRNAEREHQQTCMTILIIPVVKPQVAIQILERQYDFCTGYKPQQHCEFIPKHKDCFLDRKYQKQQLQKVPIYLGSWRSPN